VLLSGSAAGMYVVLISPRLPRATGAARGAKRLAVLPSRPLPAFAEHRAFTDAAARVHCDTREDATRLGIRDGASASTTGEGVVGLGQAPRRAIPGGAVASMLAAIATSGPRCEPARRSKAP
jgi:hypothetical protein